MPGDKRDARTRVCGNRFEARLSGAKVNEVGERQWEFVLILLRLRIPHRDQTLGFVEGQRRQCDLVHQIGDDQRGSHAIASVATIANVNVGVRRSVRSA